MAPPPPELIEDAVAEILLRLPRDEPACLVRASLVCRFWRRILSDPAFLRRYRRFHRTPPLLGFFADVYRSDAAPRFVPTAAASPFSMAAFHSHHRTWLPLDCRHGRFLLQQVRSHDLLVWDPITGDREDLYHPGIPYLSAAVLCAAPGCDHCDCHGTSSPFLVVCVGIDDMDDDLVHACVYSSQVGEWVASASVRTDGSDPFVHLTRAAVIGDEIYFTLSPGDTILKYELGSHYLSTIDLPYLDSLCYIVMPTEDGLLGLASTSESSLCLWSRMVNAEGAAGWVLCKEMELQTVLPVDNPIKRASAIGFAEGVNVIFAGTEFGTFTVDLRSGLARKVSEHEILYPVIPFTSFYTPDCACSKLPLPAE